MNRIASVLIALCFAVGFGWLAAPYAKAKAPSYFGYSSLGWVRGGVATHFGMSAPRWHGWEGIRAAVGTPFNHHKVWLEKGQTIELDYEILAERGGLRVAIYRTNLNVVLQGVMVEDHDYIRYRTGDFAGQKIYTAQHRGWHEIDIEIVWEPDTHEEIRANPYAQFVPDYDLKYDVRWRLGSPAQTDFAEAN